MAGMHPHVVVAPETGESRLDADHRPRLLFFHSPASGRCRRAEGYLAQVLQRRHNHDTFDLRRVSVDARPDLAERFRIDSVPTIVVVDGRRVSCRILSVKNCRDLEDQLRPWLH